ncbi:hypothetical protein [Alteromonas lipolytica]|uniref:Uncharacterized protein n=1 Tax=Alteromonas lipolytica TaxID=1856405 RepID=A0A1E8F964_9ALTE|nr:hypothetical protein [Alteromonas lipolytica]OFI32454.1 hypothetical protein BFC17_06995 [Alteromonas lipolytica]GGF79523.1 hypothetical protein GCM10011338_34830 [Alteromonas lipolytica]
MSMATICRISVVLVVLLCGCATNPPPLSLGERYQQLAQEESFSVYEMRTLASEAYQQGDLSLMLNAQWKLCQRAVAVNSDGEDCHQLLDLAIIEQDRLSEARANLALYFITRTQSYYQRATAVIPANGEDYSELFAAPVETCITSAQATEWQAMQCYLSGKAAGNEPALQKALTLFRRFNASHNMADSYFVLAKIKLANNEPAIAADFAAKAALLLSQLGESDKAEQVRNWRQDNVYAQ